MLPEALYITCIYKLEDVERLTQKVSLLLCDACTLYRLLLLETWVGTRNLYSVSIEQYGGTCACSCVEVTCSWLYCWLLQFDGKYDFQ